MNVFGHAADVDLSLLVNNNEYNIPVGGNLGAGIKILLCGQKIIGNDIM